MVGAATGSRTAGTGRCIPETMVGAATGSRTAVRGRSVPEPEWSVGGLKLGVAATKSGFPRKVRWEPFWAERPGHWPEDINP